MSDILNQKTRTFFDTNELFKQSAKSFSGFESIKAKEKFVSPFYAENGIKPGQNIVTDKPFSDFNCTGIDEKGNEGTAYSNDIKQYNKGTEVFDAFEKDNKSIPTDLLRMYYEEPQNNGFFNFSGKFCLLNIGQEYYDNIIKKFPKPVTSFYHKNGQRTSIEVDSLEKQAKYLKTIVDSKPLKNSLTEVEIYRALKLAAWHKSPIGEFSSVFSVNRILAEAIEYVADAVGGAQINEERYLADKYQKKDYKPLIGTSETLQLTVEGGFSTLQILIQGGLNLLKEIETVDFIPQGFKTVIDKIQNFNTHVNQVITAIKQELKEIIDETWKLANAFICGLINGLISTLEFILQLIAFLVGMFKVPNYEEYAKCQSYIESLEEILNTLFTEIPNIFNGFVQLLTNFKDFSSKAIETLFSFTKDFKNIKDAISKYQIAYYAGAIVFEVIIGVLLAVFTGGAGNVAKAVNSSEKLMQYIKLIGKEFVSSVTFGISDALALFRGLIKQFVKACENGFKGFIEWIRSLLSKESKHLDEVLDEVERISLKNYSKTEILALLIEDNINKFYSPTHLEAIYKKASQLDMNLENLRGFVKTGNIKEIKSVELLKQMDNYINIVLKRGYPFGFRNLKEFEQFCKDIEKIVVTKLGFTTFEVVIQGSSVRNVKPKDIDIGIFVDESTFFGTIIKVFNNPLEGTAKHRGMLHAIETGKITSSYAKLSKDRRVLEKTFGKIDLSVILEKGKFDIKPNLKNKKL